MIIAWSVTPFSIWEQEELFYKYWQNFNRGFYAQMKIIRKNKWEVACSSLVYQKRKTSDRLGYINQSHNISLPQFLHIPPIHTYDFKVSVKLFLKLYQTTSFFHLVKEYTFFLFVILVKSLFQMVRYDAEDKLNVSIVTSFSLSVMHSLLDVRIWCHIYLLFLVSRFSTLTHT